MWQHIKFSFWRFTVKLKMSFFMHNHVENGNEQFVMKYGDAVLSCSCTCFHWVAARIGIVTQHTLKWQVGLTVNYTDKINFLASVYLVHAPGTWCSKAWKLHCNVVGEMYTVHADTLPLITKLASLSWAWFPARRLPYLRPCLVCCNPTRHLLREILKCKLLLVLYKAFLICYTWCDQIVCGLITR
jgi:hypothetical protein